MSALSLCVLCACGAATAGATRPSSDRGTIGGVVRGGRGADSMLLGEVSATQVLDADTRWRAAYVNTSVDPAIVASLASVTAGAHVDVYFGMWCGDSVREVTRFLRYVERGGMPWTHRLIAVDRAKQAPGLTEGEGIEYVPTFVVRREGREVGRVIESPSRELGEDLVALLSGRARGALSGR